MRKRFGGRPIRVARLALIVGVVIFLAWQIIARTMAVVFERVDPEAALAWDSRRATALLQLAESHLPVPQSATGGLSAQIASQLSLSSVNKSDLAKARDLAERALRFDPSAPGALTDLGRVADGEGDSQRALALMDLAAARALRDPVAQGWLVSHDIRVGDLAAALPHLGIILRTQPEAQDDLLPILTAFASVPAASQPLIQLLATAPPWRGWFLNAISTQIADVAALRRFYAALQASPRPPTQEELHPFIDRLVKEGLYKDAYATWIEALPPDRKPGSQLLYNGAFQFPLSGSGFDWKINRVTGADITVERSEPRVLRVEFSGTRVDFHNVRHLLVLPPGGYRLTGEVSAESLHTGRGLWWHLSCAGQQGPSLGQTDLVAQNTPWRLFALSFTIPAANCQTQILQLELPARVALEQNIEGVIAYRNLQITQQNKDKGDDVADHP